MIKKFEEFVNESILYSAYEKAHMMFVTDLFMSEKEYETYNRGSNKYDEEPMLCIYFDSVLDLQKIIEGIEFIDDETNNTVDSKKITRIEIFVRPERRTVKDRFDITFLIDDEEIGTVHAIPKDMRDLIDIANRYHNLHKHSIKKIKVEDSDKYTKSTRQGICGYADNVFTDGAQLWVTKDMEGNVFLHIKGVKYDSGEYVINPTEGKITDSFFIVEERDEI